MPPQKKIPLTRIQRLIGRRMSQSRRTKPCFYIEAKADVTELMALRPGLRKSLGIKVTTNAFYIRALALAAAKYPLVLATLDSGADTITIAGSVNVGFAVTAPQGLVVPVLKSADKKTLAEIARLEKTLTEKARDNKFTLDEMEAETIALSNLGAYDMESFIAIVPPATSAILAVGNAVRTIAAHNGKPAERKMVSLTLSVDGRIIDGPYAAEFLNFIVQQLQDPMAIV